MIKNRDDLLQNLIAGMNQHEKVAGCNLEAVLLEDGVEVLKADVLTVLDWLINEIYWNEDSDWRNANTAEVRPY